MPPRRRQAATQTAEAYNYASADRLNNPTSETALGMEPDDLADQPIPEMEEDEERVRHPRLQWNRGKQTDHSRTFGPLYIHDKVSPEQFLKTITKANPQRDMWALLNGLPEDAAAKPYEYSGHWTNRLIRATAQRAMASLLYKDGMRGKVNLIYMDPPYNKSFPEQLPGQRRNPRDGGGLGRPPKRPSRHKGIQRHVSRRSSLILRRPVRTNDIRARTTAREGQFHRPDRGRQRPRSRSADGRGFRTGKPRSYHPFSNQYQSEFEPDTRGRQLACVVL